MKIRHALIPFALLAVVTGASAQTSIWRCGNTYTNDAKEAQSKGCKLVEGGNVTVVQGTKVNGNGRPLNVVTAPQANRDAPRVQEGEQRARDADARAILEAELKKAEAKRADLEKEYNNGEPEMLGPEHKNHQKYLDRITELKAAIERADQDIQGLRRELARAGGNPGPSANSATK